MVSIARDSWNRSGAYSVGQPCKYAETELMESKEMIVLEWRFSPPDDFEEQINLKRDDYELIIGRGEAQAKIRAEVYARIPTMEEDLHEALNNRFLGVQLLTHKRNRRCIAFTPTVSKITS